MKPSVPSKPIPTSHPTVPQPGSAAAQAAIQRVRAGLKAEGSKGPFKGVAAAFDRPRKSWRPS